MANQFKEISEFKTREKLTGDEYVQVSSNERVNLKDQFDRKINTAIEVPSEEDMESLIESGKVIEGQLYYILEE